jgi:hypothetical protein
MVHQSFSRYPATSFPMLRHGGGMNDCEGRSDLEPEEILTRIAADFEALDRAILAAISLLEAGSDSAAKDIAALRRAGEAARKGATVARSRVCSE